VRRAVSAGERRDWDRLPISIPFFVRGKRTSGEEFLEFSTALNLSAGGVLLATRKFLDPGTEISLEVPVAPVSLLHATVLRCIPDRQYYLLGLRFDKPLIHESLEQEELAGVAKPDEKIGSN